MKKILERLLNLVNNPNQDSLALSINNCHHKGVFSLVLEGVEPGKLLRVFIAKEKIKPIDVQIHTHRYNLNLTVLHGSFQHHIAEPCLSNDLTVQLDMHLYKSFLLGGNGLTYVNQIDALIHSQNIPIGSQLHINHEVFHSVSCSKGCIWVVEELGFEKDYSHALGVPFIVDNLYNKPEMFQINDNMQLLKKVVTDLLSRY